MKKILIEGMLGLGDNIYQRPVVEFLLRQPGQYFLKTPWPQLYEDLPIKLVRPNTTLRTQYRNSIREIERYDTSFEKFSKVIRLNYTQFQRMGMPLYRGLMESAGLSSDLYFLKLKKPAEEREDYAVIRPVTLRKEWLAPARNPKPEYIQKSIDVLNEMGISTVVVADVSPPHEVYEGSRPERASTYFERGELKLDHLMDLVHKARLVVGGVGFIAPMCQALGTPAVVIHGGAGGWNSPCMINAPAVGELTHVLPERHCKCRSHQHSCDKTIDISKLEKALYDTANRNQKAG